LLFKHKNEPQNKIQVDLGDLENEKEHLKGFLEQHLKVTVSENKDKLTVDSEKVTLSDLHHATKKFIYHKALSNTHWISLEGSTVKINRFKGPDKKKDKNKKDSQHQSLTQSWGL
jgi:hypothetical protein